MDDGCWRGDVAQYEFREHWLPLRGGLMVPGWGDAHVHFVWWAQQMRRIDISETSSVDEALADAETTVATQGEPVVKYGARKFARIRWV